MLLVGYLFHRVADLLAHLLRDRKREVLLQDIADSTLSGLAVDTDNIRVVRSSDINRINRQIWNCPGCELLILPPSHSFCDRILMGSRKCGEYKISRIWLPVTDMHSGQALIHFPDSWHI